MKRVLLLLTICMLVSGASAWASGLAIPEQGAAAMGMSAAMTARNEDLSALFYNPAGIDYVQGFEFMLGDTPIIPRHKYTPFSKTDYRDDPDYFDSAKTNSTTYLPPFLYAAWSMNRSIVLGIAVNTPFGLGTDWDPTWDGRYTSTFAEITLINVNPTITWRPSDVFSIGAGFSYYRSSATIEKMIDTGSKINTAIMANTNYDSEFNLEGDGTGYGFNLGVLYKPENSKYQWGASYRSSFDIEYDGKAKFTHQQTNITNFLTMAYMNAGYDAATAANLAQGTYTTQIAGNMPSEQDGTATLNMPWMLNLGMRTQMNTKWVVSADLDIVGWSRYKELVIDFETDKPEDTIQEKDWDNSWVVRCGTSYDFSPSFVLRGGALFDFNPVPGHTLDAQMPDSDRYGISVGTGYRFGNVSLDASYMVLKFLDRNKKNGVGYSSDVTGDGKINEFDYPADTPYYPIGNGKYESVAHLASLSLSYHF